MNTNLLNKFGIAYLHAYGQYPRLEDHGKYFTVNGRRYPKTDLPEMLETARREVAGSIKPQ